MIEFLADMFIAVVIIGLFNLIRNILNVRKILKKYQNDPTVEGITIVNGKVQVVRKDTPDPSVQEVKKEMVVDEVCHKQIEKTQAYRIVKDGVEHYFCSWECREAFLKAQKACSIGQE